MEAACVCGHISGQCLFKTTKGDFSANIADHTQCV